jgi:hypothetical protein
LAKIKFHKNRSQVLGDAAVALPLLVGRLGRLAAADEHKTAGLLQAGDVEAVAALEHDAVELRGLQEIL